VNARQSASHTARPAPVSANRALASIKTFCAFAVEQDLISVSPAAAIRAPAPETPRERMTELGAVWRASLGLGVYGAGVRLLALTGARRSEVFGMTWAELDLPGRTWTLPAARAKNGRAHQIPLSAQALDVLRELCPACTGLSKNPVFPPIGFSQSKAKLDALLPGMPAWCVHDLRRTAASGMAGLGVRIETVEKVLNHASGSFRGIVGFTKSTTSPPKSDRRSTFGAPMLPRFVKLRTTRNLML
jgi:integrase